MMFSNDNHKLAVNMSAQLMKGIICNRKKNRWILCAIQRITQHDSVDIINDSMVTIYIDSESFFLDKY